MLTFEKVSQKRKTKGGHVESEHFSRASKDVNESYLLDRWLDVSPASLQECGVHYSYVKKVRDWLDRASRAHKAHGHEPTFLPWVLALCGPSGCGKSTIVELLCKEMNIRVIEWTDDSWDPDLMIHRRIEKDSHFYLSHGSSYPGFDHAGNALYKMDDEEEFERFTRQSAYPTLDLLTTSNKAGNATTPALAGKLTSVDKTVKKEAPPHLKMKKKKSKVIFDSDDDDHLLIDSDDDFKEGTRKRKSRTRGKSRVKPALSSIESSSSSHTNTQPNEGSAVEVDYAEQSRLILMHDLPHVLARYSNRSGVSGGGSYGSANFASVDEGDNQRLKVESLTSLLPMFRDPIVLIVSDVTGRDDVHYASRSFLPHSIRDKVYSEIMYQDKITPNAMAKALQKIINTTKQQCIRNGLLWRVLSNLPTNVVIAVAEQCHGDIRHALTQLQFYVNAKYGQALSKVSNDSRDGRSSVSDGGTSSIESGNGGKSGAFDLSEVIDLTGDDSSLTALTDTATESSNTSTEPSSHRIQHVHKWDNLNQMDFDKAPVSDKGSSQRRDEYFSSLYSVAKLTNATLNADGQFVTTEVFDCDEIVANSEMPTEMLMDFVHHNFLPSLVNSYAIETYANVTSPIDATHSANKACLSFSDIDVFLTVKYDPNAALDRSQKIFPEQYVAALTSRIPAISRGIGSHERLRAGRSRGAKHTFVPMHSPQSIGIRARKRELQLALQHLSESMLMDMYHNVDGADGRLCKRRWSPKDLATSIVPYLNLQYDHLCAEWDKQSQPGYQKENDKRNSNMKSSSMSLSALGASQLSGAGRGGMMNYLSSSKYNFINKPQSDGAYRGFSIATTLTSFQLYALDMGLSPNVLNKLQAVRKAMHIDDKNNNYDILISSMTPLALQSKVDEGAQQRKEGNNDRVEEVEDIIEDFDD